MKLDFNQKEFEAWVTENIDFLYNHAGIAHPNANGIGWLKIIFAQELKIRALEKQIEDNNGR